MKKCFLKLLGILTGVITCMPATFMASAINYDSRDIDRNNNVNILDNIEFQYYLRGKKCTTDLNNIDVDGNNIVDSVDSLCIMNGIVGNNFSCQVHGSNSSFSAGTRTSLITNSISSQIYTRHKYSNNVTDSYTLTISANNTSNTMSTTSNPPGIIGPDTRTEDFLGGMVYLTGLGTGFIVGDHVIATSAHCVYGSDWCSGYQIRLYNNDGTPSNTYLNPVEAHIPSEFYNGDHNDKHDYALIVVQEDLSDYYHFNLGMPYNVYTSNNFSEYAIYSTGFSQTIPGGGSNTNPKKMYTGVGEIVNASNVDTNLICHNADITYGNSGGPVYVKETYTSGSTQTEINTVISICSGMYNITTPHYNCGPTMNPIMLKFYLSNSEVSNLFTNMS